MVSRERDVIGYLKPHVLKRASRAEKDDTLPYAFMQHAPGLNLDMFGEIT